MQMPLTFVLIAALILCNGYPISEDVLRIQYGFSKRVCAYHNDQREFKILRTLFLPLEKRCRHL